MKLRMLNSYSELSKESLKKIVGGIDNPEARPPDCDSKMFNCDGPFTPPDCSN